MGSDARDLAGEQGHRESLMFDQAARRLQLYLTAMWGRVLPLRGWDPGEGPGPQQTAIHGETLYFPSRLTGVEGVVPMARYRAAAMHMAAHVAYSPKFDAHGLKPRQRLLVELIEDARIEALAMNAFPGLKPLWSSLFWAGTPTAELFPGLIRKLSKALFTLEVDRQDPYWVNKGVQLFLERQDRLEDPEIALEMGLRLAHDLGQMRLNMNDNEPIVLATYRDDNRHLWQMTENIPGSDRATPEEMPLDSLAKDMLEEADEGVPLAFTDRLLADLNPRAGLWVEETDQPARLIYFRNPQTDAQTPVVRYPEWFDAMGLERAAWCTVREQAAPEASRDIPERELAPYRHWLKHQSRVMGLRRMRRLVRSQRYEEGDELDIDAVVQAWVERQAGDEPEARIYRSRRIKPGHGMRVSLLLDLSESVNTPLGTTSRHSLLDLARQLVLLMGEVVKAQDFPMAVGGFRSNGRHEVDYVCVKAFEDDFNTEAQARLYGLTGGGSTRMGAAIRHACAALAEEAGEHRQLFIVTDGEPSDIDVFDADHLIQDARYAVRQARQQGIRVFCVCLDAQAQPGVARIFGAAHYVVLDKVESLTPRLTQLFQKLDQAS